MPGPIANSLSGLEAGAGNLWNSAATGIGNFFTPSPVTTSMPGTPLPVDPTAAAAGTNLPMTTSTPALTPYNPPAPSIDQIAAQNYPNAPALPPGTLPLPPGGTATPPEPGQPAASGWTQIGGLLKAVGNATELYNRYQLQQNLQDPNWVASQIAKLQVPLGKNLKNAVGRGVQAQAQEAGLGGAPGLFRQAMAEALAPYQFAEQQNAENEFISSIGASEGAYPLGGGLGDFGSYGSAFPQATAA